ncbi:MAG: hypothetical protein GWN58_51280, partial [Anaerolineae bacterium]|nr:hypothetical protein [Anaerolineae bacterium]
RKPILAAFLLCLSALVATGQDLCSVYMIQGPDGPQVASRPPQEQLDALKALSREARITAVKALANQGAIIDVPVDVWGWDCNKTMKQRQIYGYKWVPNALMANIVVAPGLNVPSLPSYKPKPPVGAILVPPKGGWKKK